MSDLKQMSIITSFRFKIKWWRWFLYGLEAPAPFQHKVVDPDDVRLKRWEAQVVGQFEFSGANQSFYPTKNVVIGPTSTAIAKLLV